MLNAQPKVPVRSSVAPKLVGDQNARCASVLLEELSHEPFSRMRVAPALHQYVKHRTVALLNKSIFRPTAVDLA